MRRFRSSVGKCGVALLAAVALGSLGLMAVTAWAQVQTYNCPGGFQPVIAAPVPAVLMSSLQKVPNPVIPKDPVTGAPLIRADLADYVANLNVAIRLGKAFFWDMQAGSDNKTACATCHFQAGADVRTKNQLNPGPTSTGFSPNYTLAPSDFPFTTPTNDRDDIAGSQGVRVSTFLGFSKSGAELTSTPTGFRQVTGDHSPSAVNAVFNHRQFWNGRAQPDFNGVNPFGSRDTSARVWVLDYRGFPVQVYINIRDASLASQAVGPPINPVEMSAAGRTFPDLGKKMLLLKPLGLQKVDPTDSVLGPIADTTTGLKTTYTALIQQAFQPKWWNSNKSVSVGGKSYTMMQANFSLYWGLALMLYQATLVSDYSPMDQYLATRVLDPLTGALVSDDPNLLQPVVTRLALEGITVTTQEILNGLDLFELPVAPPPSFPVASGFGVGCIACHVGAETTSASMRNLVGPGVEPEHIAFKNAGFDTRMERMFSILDWTPPGPLSPVPLGADVITFDPSIYDVDVISIDNSSIQPTIPLPVATYDVGWYNLGVRPTADDPGLGGKDPFGKWLSWTMLYQASSNPIKVPGGTLECPSLPGNPTFPNQVLNPSGFPLLSGPLTKTEPTDVAGTFKVPALRNVELNGPYFHNGGKSTLRQVVEFYDDAGDFTNPTKHPLMVPLQLTAQQIKDLVAFMVSLTDERVLYQKAPFDHPALVVPNGQDANGADITITLPAVGAAGGASLPRFLNLNPFCVTITCNP